MAAATKPQIDWIVPSSAHPPKAEWTLHLWYGLFTAAAQASSTLNDAEAAELVALFANAAAGLPCVKCKAHYRENFKAQPFTLKHARSPSAALEWIVRLRRLIAVQVRAAHVEKKRSLSRMSRDAPLPPAALFTNIHTEEDDRLDRAVHALLATPLKTCDCNMAHKDVAPATTQIKRRRSVLDEK